MRHTLRDRRINLQAWHGPTYIELPGYAEAHPAECWSTDVDDRAFVARFPRQDRAGLLAFFSWCRAQLAYEAEHDRPEVAA